MILGTLGKITAVVLTAFQEIWMDDSCHCRECFQAMSAYFPLRYYRIILHLHDTFILKDAGAFHQLHAVLLKRQKVFLRDHLVYVPVPQIPTEIPPVWCALQMECHLIRAEP